MRWQTALWDAVAKSDADLVSDILQLDKVQTCLRENSEQVYFDEEAPLHLAAYCGYNELLGLMLDGGFDVDSYNEFRDESGYRVTALHFAVYKDKVGTVRFLLSRGADPDLFGRWGDAAGTAEDFAREREHWACLEVLQEHEHTQDAPIHGQRSVKLQLELAMKQRRRKRRELQELDETIAELMSRHKDSSETIDDRADAKDRVETSHVTSTRGSSDCVPSCAVCLSPPRRKAYSCWRCDCLLCAACRSRVAVDQRRCPSCRAEFKGKMVPRRNRWAERLAELLRAKESE